MRVQGSVGQKMEIKVNVSVSVSVKECYYVEASP